LLGSGTWTSWGSCPGRIASVLSWDGQRQCSPGADRGLVPTAVFGMLCWLLVASAVIFRFALEFMGAGTRGPDFEACALSRIPHAFRLFTVSGMAYLRSGRQVVVVELPRRPPH